jgi:hypothetical protein
MTVPTGGEKKGMNKPTLVVLYILAVAIAGLIALVMYFTLA